MGGHWIGDLDPGAIAVTLHCPVRSVRHRQSDGEKSAHYLVNWAVAMQRSSGMGTHEPGRSGDKYPHVRAPGR